MDGTEYFFQNVATDFWLGPGNSWGTQASVMRYPQNFKAVKVSDGVYKFDSHIYNGANNHFLGDGYTDNGGDQWNVIAAGDGTYYLKAISGNQKNKYISSEEAGKAVTFLDATTENSKWKIYSYDGVRAKMAEATVDNPVKITELIEANTFSRNSITDYYKPWNRTGFDGKGSPANSAIGGNDYACAESYHSNNGFKFAQTIDSCVVPGVYVLDAQAFYRQDGSDTENMPYFAVNGVKTYFPLKTGEENNMEQAYASFLEKKYPVKSLYFGVGEDTKKLEIEIANKNTAMWNIFGELELSYLGDGADAYQLLLDSFLVSKPDYESIEYKTADVYSEYEFALEEHTTATNYDDFKAAKDAINEAEEALIENIAAWKALIEARDEAVNNVVNNEKIVGEDKEALGDYITGTINNQVLSEKSASNEELAAYTAEIKRLEAIAVENGMVFDTDGTWKYIATAAERTTYKNYDGFIRGISYITILDSWDGEKLPTANMPEAPTAIKSVKSAQDSNVKSDDIYDLSGKRANADAKGIIIENGIKKAK